METKLEIVTVEREEWIPFICTIVIIEDPIEGAMTSNVHHEIIGVCRFMRGDPARNVLNA